MTDRRALLWDESAVALLTRLCASGEGARIIAAEMHRELGGARDRARAYTKNAVISMVHRRGIEWGRRAGRSPKPRGPRIKDSDRGGGVHARIRARGAPLPAPPPAPPVLAAPESRPCTFAALEETRCAWPLEVEGVMFCGGAVLGRSRYCAFHAVAARR